MPEEQKRLLETAARDPACEHIYCAAVCGANTSMRRVNVNHVCRRRLTLEKPRDIESTTGKGVLYIGYSKNETSKREIQLDGAASTRMAIYGVHGSVSELNVS